MKTFPDLWANYCARHPQLRNPDAKIQMPVSQLKAALELAWNEGREEGFAEAKKPDEPNPFPDAFGSIFGPGKFGGRK